jgi:ADP-ribosylation factor-like protein 4
MGGLFSRRDRAIHLVILGLDAAGKSTVLYQLRFHQYVSTTPTIGFNYERVRANVSTLPADGVTFAIWDVGGQDKVRPLWRSYTRSTDGIFFVVDSCDSDRLEEAKVELLRTARVPETLGVPIVVLANKQDLPGSRNPDDIQKLLSLNEMTGRPWSIHPACAVTGEGLDEAIGQLYDMIVKRRKAMKQSRRRR